MDDNKKAKHPIDRPRKKRRLLKVFAALALLAILLVAALPWMLGTAPARGWVLGQINAQLAPGSVELEGLGLSWSGPVELSGVSLRDPKGKVVLAARRLVLDRGLLGLVASRPDYGTITIEGATVDVERRPDGTIDVLDALASALTPAPAPAPAPDAPAVAPAPSTTAVAVVLKGGTLRVASPELVEPIVAGSLDASVTVAPGLPTELVATLADEGRSLEIRATIEPASATGRRSLKVTSKNWPIHARNQGVEAKGRFEGTIDAKQENGLWTLRGDAAISGVEAAGPVLAGDRLALDRVAAACDVEQSASGWSVRKFELTSPVASLRGAGSIPAAEGAPTQLRGRVDLAALAKMIPNAMKLRDGLTIDRGSATIGVDLASRGGADRLDLVASLDDFAATEGGRPVTLRGPVRLSARASRASEKVTVEALELKAAGVDVSASGDLEAGVKLSGTVDLVALNAQLRDVLDLGALDLSGHARLAADYRHAGDSFKGRLAADCRNLKITGLTADPIDREIVRLDASILGANRPDGIPVAWREAKLDLKAADLKLDLVATSQADGAALVAGLGMDVASPVPGRFEAKAAFRRDGPVFDFDELRGGVTPGDPKAAPIPLALAVRGRVDLASGEGSFEPLPGSDAGAFGLGAAGAKVSGLGRADAPTRVDAALAGDLAALDRLLAGRSGSPPKGLAGAWSGRLAVARSASGKLDVDAKVEAPQITAPGLNGPVSLAVKGGYSPEGDRLDLSTLDLLTNSGRVVVAASLAETKGRKLLDLTGTVEPNWATVDKLVAASVEENARFRAQARPIRLAGSLRADTTDQLLEQIQGEVGLDLTMAEAFGVVLTPAPVVLKMGGGRAKFDPIVTTMNGGPVLIQADLALDADYGLWLRLNPCRIQDAAINEAVSNSILAYAAPVLARSSGVSGKVTVALDRGLVPITANGLLRLEGAMALQNAIFKPGSIGSELEAITGQPTSDIRLDQTMIVQVADGRVRQTGLNIPVGGNGARVAIEGSVGFDQTLDLKATMPLTAKALGVDPRFDKVARGTTVVVPIRGTFARPDIDRRALTVALRDAARKLGEKELKSEAGRFLDRIANPKNP